MASITTPNDYTGQYVITNSTLRQAKIQACIDSVESEILCQLFGVDFKDIVLDGVDNLDPIYEMLFNPFTVQDSCNRILISKGVKEMLQGFVYFKWYSFHQTTETINGIRNKESENSSQTSSVQSSTELRYNEAVRTYKAIQAYILDNLDIYPEFKGVKKRLTSWF
jgi:hypothetical protein